MSHELSFASHSLFVLPWTLLCAWIDVRTRRVPNWVFVIGFLGALFLRIRYELIYAFSPISLLLTVIACTFAFQVWALRWWGGADAKFIMVLSIALPSPAMMIFLLLGILLPSVIYFVRKYGLNLKEWVQVSLSKANLDTTPKHKTMPAVATMTIGWITWMVTINVL